MKVHVADKEILTRLLIRKQKHPDVGYEVDLGVVLRDILTWAKRLVPSEAGSILLDDPVLKIHRKRRVQLFFAACFGKNSSSLAGTSLSERWGIAGETYRGRRPYISKDVRKDVKFYPKIDEETGYKTMSIICAPIVIEGAVVGVIELINRKGRISYDANDLALLEIFAGYTATLIHNALIARSFEELSKIDSLTGLYNDRYFFHSLESEVGRVFRSGGDLTLIFFDLDRFKEVNDKHGHLAGSTVLKEVADILREIFSGTKAVMARYGGDEYVVVLPETSLNCAGQHAHEIRARIARNTFLRKKGPSGEPPLNISGLITCSIGVAALSGKMFRKGSIRETAENLIKAADSAMYSAKDMGKNRIFIHGADKATASKQSGSSRRKKR